MEKIYSVDLSEGRVEQREYDIRREGFYGRGLALKLLADAAPLGADRCDPENALVFVPGLFAGCRAPSSGRMTILSKGGPSSVQVCNVTGNMPQKLGSLNVCALVVKGRNDDGNAVLHIGSGGAELLHMHELGGLYTDGVIGALKGRFGREAAIVGTGMAGDMRLPLSTFFCTYPDGEPEYSCPRSGFGDVPGSKGLRAVVVTGGGYFSRECGAPGEFARAGKELASLIVRNEVCGSALPSQGSKALLTLLGEGGTLGGGRRRAVGASSSEGIPAGRRKNYCCAPMCVVGCLNRQGADGEKCYDSPDQSELEAALRSCFAIDDGPFVSELQRRLRSLCLVLPEFVTAARSYFAATGLEPSRSGLLALVDEIERGSAVGRLVGSRTEGIAAAFPLNEALRSLTDSPAIADEGHFKVKMALEYEALPGVGDMDLMYRQIFVLENLGLCMFTAFALVNSMEAAELLARLFRCKTGLHGVTGADLIAHAADCIDREREYAVANGAQAPRINVPAFTRVLYRYFSR